MKVDFNNPRSYFVPEPYRVGHLFNLDDRRQLYRRLRGVGRKLLRRLGVWQEFIWSYGPGEDDLNNNWLMEVQKLPVFFRFLVLVEWTGPCQYVLHIRGLNFEGDEIFKTMMFTGSPSCCLKRTVFEFLRCCPGNVLAVASQAASIQKDYFFSHRVLEKEGLCLIGNS